MWNDLGQCMNAYCDLSIWRHYWNLLRGIDIVIVLGKTWLWLIWLSLYIFFWEDNLSDLNYDIVTRKWFDITWLDSIDLGVYDEWMWWNRWLDENTYLYGQLQVTGVISFGLYDHSDKVVAIL